MSQLSQTSIRKRDPDLRQRTLVEAAVACFAEHGFDGATTRAIAERSGCAEGLIHRYFGGKRGLLEAVLVQKTNSIVDGLNDVPYREGLREDLEALLLWTLDTMWEARQFMRVAIAQTLTDPELGSGAGRRLNQARTDALRQRLERHQASGQLKPGSDLQALAELLAGLALHFGFFNQIIWDRDRALVRAQSLEALSAVLDGVASDQGGRA